MDPNPRITSTTRLQQRRKTKPRTMTAFVAAPSLATSSSSSDDEEIIGYNDQKDSAAVPASDEDDSEYYTMKLQESAASKYGYEDAAPTKRDNLGRAAGNRRKSSLTNSLHRRDRRGSNDSVGSAGSITNHYTMKPRRSSLKDSLYESDDERIKASKERRRKSGSHIIEVRVRGQREPVKRSRSIEFNRRVKVQDITPLTEMDPTVSKDDIWLQSHELKEMKLQRRRDIQEYQNVIKTKSNSSGNLKDMVKQEEAEDAGNGGGTTGTGATTTTECCFRGLERYIDVNKRVIRDRRTNAYHAVIMEQAKQEFDGEYDEEEIAKLYKKSGNTRTSTHTARILAQQDTTETEDYLMSPQTKKLVLAVGDQREKNKIKAQQPSEGCIFERRRISIG